MTDNLSAQPNEEPQFDITVIIEGGNCIGVLMNGERIRAEVHDYDVQYPINQLLIEQDEEGRDYLPLIVE